MKRLLLAIAITLTATSAEAQWLKQSTAATINLGPFIDSTDGVTAETALTVSQADVRLSKNGGDYAQKNEASAATHDELGEYKVALDATDTNTLGRLRIMVQESGALPVWKEYMVLPANTYDSLVGGTDYIETNVKQVDDTAASSALASAADIAQAVWEYVIGTEPTDVPPTAGTTEVLDMLKYVYYYGGGFNKVNSDLTSGEGEMQYYDSGGTKRFERDVTKSGTVTTKDEVRAND